MAQQMRYNMTIQKQKQRDILNDRIREINNKKYLQDNQKQIEKQ